MASGGPYGIDASAHLLLERALSAAQIDLICDRCARLYGAQANALASTDQRFEAVQVRPGVSAFWWRYSQSGDAFGGGFGRLADGSGIAGSWRAGWAGGFR
jgi:hypothetical protein